MIKLTADPAVLQALQLAFPTPRNAAKRALDKYLAVLEQMLNGAIQRGLTPLERKLGLYPISLHQLANRGGQIGPQKVRLHKWLADHGLELVTKVLEGSKFAKQVSQVKLSPRAVLHVVSGASAAVSSPVLVSAAGGVITDADLDVLLAGTPAAAQGLFHHLYPEFARQWRPQALSALFDYVPVDTESLKSFALWLGQGASLFSVQQRQQLLQHTMTILAVAKVTRGFFVQRKNPSVFGRMYYHGLSVQSAHKELRRAMLGNCWEYDVRSSVVAWKMGFARSLLIDAGVEVSVRPYFPNTLLYLEEKADFMSTVRRYTFEDDSPVPADFQLQLLKQAFTAISFGARAQGKGWLDAAGNWTNPALVDILRNGSDRTRFLKDPAVRGFIAEQKLLDAYIFAKVQQSAPNLLRRAELQTASGRPSRAKLLAYLYQHDETAVMEVVRRVAAEYGHVPIANVHDAIFFKRRLGADLKDRIEFAMREETGNPYWRLAPTQIERFNPRSLDAEREVQEHRARMLQEEKAAAQWKKSRSSDPDL